MTKEQENKFYYSLKSNKLYQSDYDKEIPQDAVEIDYITYQNLQNVLAQNLEIILDEKGKFIILPPKIYYSASTKGFYNSQIHKSLPKDAVEIDDATHQNLLSGQANGKVISVDKNGQPILTEPVVQELSLDEVKDNFSTQIDKDAENQRLKYITAGDGQVLTYLEKANQALDYSGKYTAHLADDSQPLPSDDQYPLLSASLNIDGNTLLEVAESVTFSYTLWQQIGAEIEKIRLQAKAAIDAAKTSEDAQAVYDNVTWPNP